MIYFYSGTPGSGKSLHLAERLYWWLRAGKPAIGNFALDLDKIGGKKKKNYTYLRNDQLTPQFCRTMHKNTSKSMAE